MMIASGAGVAACAAGPETIAPIEPRVRARAAQVASMVLKVGVILFSVKVHIVNR